MVARVQRPELEQARAARRAGRARLRLRRLDRPPRRHPSTGTDLEFVTRRRGLRLARAVLLLFRVLAAGGSSTLRRAIGMVADNAATTYCLIRMDEGGAFVLGVYLFVAFGNGFRFGRASLHASQVLSIVGFGDRAVAVAVLVAARDRRHGLHGRAARAAVLRRRAVAAHHRSRSAAPTRRTRRRGASSPTSATRCARRSTASSRWPTCCARPTSTRRSARSSRR